MKALNTVLLAGLGLVAVNANALTIDTNGSAAGGLITTDVNSLDWIPGNAVIDNIAITENKGEFTFSMNYQARLGAFADVDGSPIFSGVLNNPTPGAGGFEVTMQWSQNFRGTLDANGGMVAVGDGNGTAAFYLDTSQDSNSLLGTGFGGGGVGVIELLTATTASSIFSYDITAGVDGTGLVLLDQAGGDDYSGMQSITANGSSTTILSGISYNSDYITDDLSGMNLIATFNSSNILPYNSVNPTLEGNTIANSLPIDLGAFNGSCAVDFANTGTCSVLFQADGNISVTAEIPEPGTLLTMALGLGMLGFTAKKRKQK